LITWYNVKKIVVFGAGKIGRSFLGQLFSISGYEVIFVDIDKLLIEELNKRRNYNIVIKSDSGEEIINIENVRGLIVSDEESVTKEISDVEIIAISVGIGGLPKIFPVLAKGLLFRYISGNKKPVDIIIGENMRNAGSYFHNGLTEHLPAGYPIDSLTGLIETSIGKMVPLMTQQETEEDILKVYAEPYNLLVLDKKGFKNPIPDVKGLQPKENMKAWVDRKLFIHNLGHSASAYIGYLNCPDFKYIYQVLSIPDVITTVRLAMLQAAEILLKKYPGEFSYNDLDMHIHDLLTRFQNKALKDTIFRVGCDLNRKLGMEDRLAGAIRLAIEMSLPYDKILFALICGCHFRAKDDNGSMLKEDVKFINKYGSDVEMILSDICGFDENTYPQLFRESRIIESTMIISKFFQTR
jgi:mannitol-1-phosphate 5-dehydrogenase